MVWTRCHKSMNKFPKKSCISLFGRFVLEFCSGRKNLWLENDALHPVATPTAMVFGLQKICVTLTRDRWSGAKAAMASPAEANAACAHSVVNSRCHQIIWNVHEASQMEKLLGYATAAMGKKDQTLGTAPAPPRRQPLNYVSVWTSQTSLGVTRPSSKGGPVGRSKRQRVGSDCSLIMQISPTCICPPRNSCQISLSCHSIVFPIQTPTKQRINYLPSNLLVHTNILFNLRTPLVK